MEFTSSSIGCRAPADFPVHTGVQRAADRAEESRIDLTSDCEAPAVQADSGRATASSPSRWSVASEAVANGNSCPPAQQGRSNKESPEVCKRLVWPLCNVRIPVADMLFGATALKLRVSCCLPTHSWDCRPAPIAWDAETREARV